MYCDRQIHYRLYNNLQNKYNIIIHTAIMARSETGENIVSSLIVNKNIKIQQQQQPNSNTAPYI